MKYLALLMLCCTALMTGCSTVHQSHVDLDLNLVPKEQKIGLYVSPLPKITTAFPGANCLLCLGAAAVANSALTKQVETFQADELAKTRETITALLEAKGYKVVAINQLLSNKQLPKVKPKDGQTINRNYSPYKKQYDVDQLMVVDFRTVGVWRNYSSYFPTGVPQVNVDFQYYMIDIANNRYSFYFPLQILKSADGVWDTPPTFANLTNAFYQAEEEAVDHIKKALD